MRRQLNLKLLVGLLAAFAAAGGGVHLVHGFQQERNAGALLGRADRAEEEGDAAAAEKYLGRYLAYRPDDEEAQARYGLSLARHAADGPSRLRSLLTLERILLHFPDRDDVRRRAVELAMAPEIGQIKEAGEHLVYLLLRPGLGRPPTAEDRRRMEGLLLDFARRDAGRDPSPPPGLERLLARHDAEAEDLLGRCLEGLARDVRPEEARARLGQASGCYEIALIHDPGRIEAYVHLAGLLRGPLQDAARADRVMDAREVEGGLIARNPRSARAYLERARYREANGIAGAEEDVARAGQLAPDQVDVILATAASTRKRGDLEAARKILGRGDQLHPRDVRVLQSRAELEAQSGHLEEAISALRRGLEVEPARLDLQFGIAELQARAGKPEEADREIARMRLGGDIHSAPLDYLEGSLRAEQGRWPEAIRLLEKARALADGLPGQPELAEQADLLLARGYERLGNPDRQLAAGRRVLGRDPGSLPARMTQAAALLAMGRADEALEAYRKIAPRDPAALVIVARLLFDRNLRLPEAQRRWHEVGEALDEASRAMPDSAEVAILRARALAARGSFDQALDRLRRARDEQPQRVELWIALAELAGGRGQPEATLAALDEAQRQLGDRVELSLARVEYWGRRGGEGASRALAQLARDAGKFPGDDRLRLEDGLALAYARIGDRKEAERLWEGVAAARPRDPQVVTRRFDLALVQDDEDRMRACIARLKEIEGEDGALWRYAEASRLARKAERGDATGLVAARALLAELASRRPGWARMGLLEAKVAELEKDPDRAISCYLKAIDGGERRPEAILRVAQLLTSRGRDAEVERLVERLIGQGPAFGVAARLGAEVALRRKDNARALELARQAVSPDSADYRDQLWLGQILSSAGRTEEVEARLRRAVALADTRPDTWLALISFLARAGRKDAARAEVEKARAKLPPDQVPSTLAAGYELIGDATRADEQVRAALAARPDDPATLMAAARHSVGRGRMPEAEALLRKLLAPQARASRPEILQANRSLASCLILQGGPARLQEAMQIVDRNLREEGGVEDLHLRVLVLASQPYRSRETLLALEDLTRRQAAQASERLLLAQIYLKGREWAKARAALLSWLAYEGEGPMALAGLAECSLGQGQHDEAGPWIEKLEKVAPESFRTKELKARRLEMQGRGDEAVAVLREYARGKDADPGAATALLEELGHPAEAEAVYREFMTRTPRPDSELKLAALLARRGRVGDALDACERAWRTCPPEAVGSACLGVLYASQAGDESRRRVERWLDDAMRKSPDSLSLRFDLANLRSLQRRYRDAEAMLRQILARDANNAFASNNLALLLALEKRGRIEESLALVDRAIAAIGPHPALLQTRAVAYLGQGRGDLAAKDLEAVLAEVATTKDQIAIAHFLLARVHLQDGSRAAVVENFRKAVAAGLKPGLIHPLERETYDKLLGEFGRDVAANSTARGPR